MIREARSSVPRATVFHAKCSLSYAWSSAVAPCLPGLTVARSCPPARAVDALDSVVRRMHRPVHVLEGAHEAAEQIVQLALLAFAEHRVDE